MQCPGAGRAAAYGGKGADCEQKQLGRVLSYGTARTRPCYWKDGLLVGRGRATDGHANGVTRDDKFHATIALAAVAGIVVRNGP